MPFTIEDAMIGEIGIFPSDKIPAGWLPCDGQILPVAANQALFSLLGTTYGGDGRTTFALPDLRGRVPIHNNTSDSRVTICKLGAVLGEAAHPLTTQELPAHNHKLYGSANTGTTNSPVDSLLATAPDNVYGKTAADSNLKSSTLEAGAQPQPHQNMQPYLTLCFCISNQGIYPTRD